MKCLCQNDYNRLKYFHLTLSMDSIKAPHVAEHRVAEQRIRQYLFKLPDGAIDPQRVRRDSCYAITRFPKLA